MRLIDTGIFYIPVAHTCTPKTAHGSRDTVLLPHTTGRHSAYAARVGVQPLDRALINEGALSDFGQHVLGGVWNELLSASEIGALKNARGCNRSR